MMDLDGAGLGWAWLGLGWTGRDTGYLGRRGCRGAWRGTPLTGLSRGGGDVGCSL